MPKGSGKHAYPLVLTILCVMALVVPARWHIVGTALGGVMELLVSPISGPITRLRDWLHPIAPEPVPGTIAALEETLRETRTQYLQTLDDNRRLRETIQSLGVLRWAGSSASVELVPAAVVGTAADPTRPTLTLRVGQSDGIEQGVAVTLSSNPSQVLGVVRSVRAKTCTVTPITTFGAGELEVAVAPMDEALARDPTQWLRARITPTGDGTLRGDLEDRKNATGERIEPAVGGEVRLLDGPGWPASARMLVVGRVRATQPSPRQPLRLMVVVEPTVDDLSRVREVWVRLPMGSKAGTQ